MLSLETIAETHVCPPDLSGARNTYLLTILVSLARLHNFLTYGLDPTFLSRVHYTISPRPLLYSSSFHITS